MSPTSFDDGLKEGISRTEMVEMVEMREMEDEVALETVGTRVL